MKDIILVGGGGHCKSVIDVLEQEGKFKIIGIIDKPELLGSKVLGYPVIGSDSDLEGLSRKYKYALITIGQIKTSALRTELFNKSVAAGFILPKVISPRAYVSKHAMIGNGTIVMHDAIINANTIVGDNCIVNSKALIEHDCRLSDHCHVSTRATLNGGVVAESGCFIGSGAVVKESIVLKKGEFIRAGSLKK